MRTVTLPGGEEVPALGLGTWHMGEREHARGKEADALRAGLDLGLTLIDTAEMYGDGGAERVVGAAVAGRRDQVFIVSKVLPQNASHAGTLAACDRSLSRLRTDRIDLYLLHWRGRFPLAATVAAFEALKRSGKIRYWGVSNFDIEDMAELMTIEGGRHCATNQVLYHLGERGIEWQLLPDAQARGQSIMAYSPLAQGRILRNGALGQVAAKHGTTPAVAAVAWTLRNPGIISIPKSSNVERVKELARAADLVLDAEDLAALDKAFPRPPRSAPLAMI